MKYLNLCLLAVSFLFASLASQAQTADEVIAKYVEAIGGKDNLSKINSMYMENLIEVMGNEAPSTMIVLNGKGAKTVSDVMGQKMVQCYTDKGGWMINPMGGSTDPVDMPADQYNAGKTQIYIADVLSDPGSKGYKAELVPNEDASDKSLKIKLTSPENIVFNYFIDPETYYVKKILMSGNMMGQDVQITSTLSDYRKTDQGLVLPFKTEVDYGGQFSLVLNTKKVEFNKPVDPAIFEKGNTSL